MLDIGERRAEEADPVIQVEGYTIELGPRMGYRMVVRPDRSDPWVALYQIRNFLEDLDKVREVLVKACRVDGYDWETIGVGLGVSRDTAARRWSHVDDSPDVLQAIDQVRDEVARIKAVAR